MPLHGSEAAFISWVALFRRAVPTVPIVVPLVDPEMTGDGPAIKFYVDDPLR